MNISKKIAAIAVAAALTVGGLSATQSASAAEIPGTLTVTPTSGNVSDTYLFNSIALDIGAVAPYNVLAGTFAYQNGVEMGSLANARNAGNVPSTAGTSGLNGSAAFHDRSISPTNNFVSNKQLTALVTPLVTGNWELRWYYFASTTAPNRTTDPYVKLNMTFDSTTGAWAVYSAPAAAVASTTSLTAQATGSAVTLKATVAPAAAVGTVSFSEGSTVVAANVAVSGGVATANLPAVTDGPHSYTATFTPTNAANFTASTSTAASVYVGAIVQSTNVTTSVAAGAGGGVLTLTGVPASVALGAATLNAGTLNASGTLNAVVTDSRQLDFPAWSLTGQIADFKSGTKVLSGKYLGWTPSVTGAPNSVAGAVVLPAPGSVSGLTTVSTLATGAPNNVEVSNVSALLQLKAPKNTPAGDYSAVLTLTLI
ncbi:hypothetical protein GCM10007382_15630 [Salinibacterium xinjiangense]|uniref:Ig-like domain (Group 3) n=1 Tax=Salinibacterium xinjiangense TaxID=386302 RepID=A0A2C8YAT8_9MICO|nr:Ig-like domain-containing protein [Salinibacterium xinjiangense]GGK96245.1 hypothetical protein GCM10007382_15630 [Salinibacterium xinjiangense]SOE47353.1 Ig-like domain (group 3) [Salinibacterium xinjiangense]